MEADFNRVYDTDHAARLSVVPGVRSVARFQLESSSRTENMPRFMAIYVLDSPAVMDTKEWQDAAAAGDWRPLIRPHTFNRENHVWRLMKTTKA